MAGHFQSAWRIIKAPAFVIDCLNVHESIHLFKQTTRCVSGTSCPMSSWRTQTEPFFNRTAVAHHERELPHDDFRRAHYDFRGAHFN
jgi:hypothetical protein